MEFPWSKEEKCKHLVNYQGNNIEIAGVSIPNIFTIGNLSIKPHVLQNVENAIQALDLVYYHNCQTLKQAPDEESKKKYYEIMTIQQQKLNDIAMAITMFRSTQDSEKLGESLVKTVERNLDISMPEPKQEVTKIDLNDKV